MWQLLILVLIVIVILLFLLNTPRTPAKVTSVPEKVSPPPTSSQKLLPQETLRSSEQVPERAGYVVMEHHTFNIKNRELHLVLYGRNLDAYVRGFWKSHEVWTSIPQMETNVQLDYIPVLRNLAQDGDYLVYTLHHNVLLYKYHDNDMKIILTSDTTLPFFKSIDSVKLGKHSVHVNDREYPIKNMKLSITQ